jgi:hypothetical protein
MTTEPDIRLRALPSVDSVLKTDAAVPAITRFGRPAAVVAVRQALDAARADLLAGKTQQSEAEAIARTALAKLAADARSKLCPVFNLTGTVLHTNLGRALIAEAAVEAAVAALPIDSHKQERSLSQSSGWSMPRSHSRAPIDILSPAKRAALIACLNGDGVLHKRYGVWSPSHVDSYRHPQERIGTAHRPHPLVRSNGGH